MSRPPPPRRPRPLERVGKTEVAKTLADVLGTRLIRLQCYEGIDVAHALYDWNYERQMLYIRTLEAARWEHGDPAVLHAQMAKLHRSAHALVWITRSPATPGTSRWPVAWRRHCRTSTPSCQVTTSLRSGRSQTPSSRCHTATALERGCRCRAES